MSRRCNIASQVHQLLHAHLLLRRDVDYIVVDGEVVLVDPVTGRRRPDSRYRNGLHAAIEAKEHLPPRPEPEVHAQISVQGYLSLYRHVCGMTGTALAAADEFRRFYALKVEVVPPTKRPVRTDHPTRLFDRRADKQAALVSEVRHWRRMGRPVLVGTAAVRESEAISELLRRHDVPHTVLNAVTSASEAAVVAAAGRFGAVTVATNMAGRGTDILLEPGLDHRVADGCARMAAEALADGAPAVTLRCSTAEEAAAAETALREAGVAAERCGRPHDVVARPDDAEARSGAPITLEFGLGASRDRHRPERLAPHRRPAPRQGWTAGRLRIDPLSAVRGRRLAAGQAERRPIVPVGAARRGRRPRAPGRAANPAGRRPAAAARRARRRAGPDGRLGDRQGRRAADARVLRAAQPCPR